ncbi:unnamed protein product [Rotaria sordida]|uniref:Uncharacterized protein n=1 Tax=Rotaria sordida TaxID=392033 RepID=A0A814DLY2_9BILA|nr:unnamed protein product [Rotaria sordida]
MLNLNRLMQEKLYAMYQNEEEHENEDLLTLDEKKKKFDEYKQIHDKQTIQYEELINTQEQKHPIIYDLRKRINEFQQMNEAFYNSLSATQVELKTDEDDHWQ